MMFLSLGVRPKRARDGGKKLIAKNGAEEESGATEQPHRKQSK